MATAYTAPLYNGKEITFKQFAIRCARAFGPLATMRDEPLNAPVPDKIIPSDFHLKKLEKAKQRLKEVESWNDTRCEIEAEKYYQEEFYHYQETLDKTYKLRKRYEDMLEKVEAWIPPTYAHRELKNFMVQQLIDSIEVDCGWKPNKPKKLSGFEFRKQQIAKARQDIEYHTEKYAEKVKYARLCNGWLQALKESLEGGETK